MAAYQSTKPKKWPNFPSNDTKKRNKLACLQVPTTSQLKLKSNDPHVRFIPFHLSEIQEILGKVHLL